MHGFRSIHADSPMPAFHGFAFVDVTRKPTAGRPRPGGGSRKSRPRGSEPIARHGPSATKPRKNPHAVALGKRGGKARAAWLTKEQLRAIGRLGGRPKGSSKKPPAKS